jgi:uncharacterized protein involved in exopolysaccharide biosynthesis
MSDLRNAHLIDPNVSGTLSADGEVELMSSDAIAIEVVKRLKLYEIPEYSPTPGSVSKAVSGFKNFLSMFLPIFRETGQATSNDNMGDLAPEVLNELGMSAMPKQLVSALRALKSRVEIRRRGITDIIAIEATSVNPTRAAVIANAYAEVYLAKQVDAKLKSIDRAEAALASKLAELDGELRRSEAHVGLRQVYQEISTRLKAVSQLVLCLQPFLLGLQIP